MANLTDYLENALLNHVLRNTPYTSPTTVYVALFTTATTDAGGGTEVAGGSYARQAVTFGAPSGGSSSNTGQLVYNNMPGVTVTHAAIMDAPTGGNMLFHNALQTPRVVPAADTFTFNIAQVTATLE